MKYMGFQIVSTYQKLKKTLQTDWPNTFLRTTLERGFEEMFLEESQRKLWCIIWHSKKHTLMDQFFFQNPYCWFILVLFWKSLTKPTTPSTYIDNLFHYGHAKNAWPHPRKTSPSNCSFHWYLIPCKNLSTSNSFWDFKT